MKTYVHLKTSLYISIAVLVTIARKYPSTDEWINKMGCIHTMEYYLKIKRNEVLAYAITWIYLENIIQSERNQLLKTTYYIIPFI